MTANQNISSSLKAFNTIMLFFFLLFLSPTGALIVPQELPSILSLVYSNIPPLKKGTDSRLGFGFRLGEHADFQVIMELGPQKETKPIGDQDNNNSFNKRQVSKDEQFAQLQQQMRLKFKQLQQAEEKQKRQVLKNPQKDGATPTDGNTLSWLESWSQNINSNEEKIIKPNLKKEFNRQVLPTLPTLNGQSLKQLQLLYKLATTEGSVVSDDDFPKSVEAPIFKSKAELKNKQKITKELMDVRLDDEE